MSEFDKDNLIENGHEYTYMMTVSGRASDKEFLVNPPLKNVISVEVVQARIPLSEYTIEDDRDTLVISQDISGETVTESFELPKQNYSPGSLCDIVGKLMETVTMDITMIERSPIGTFFMHSTLGPFKIHGSSTCWYPMGLHDSVDISSTPVTDLNGLVTHIIEFPNRYDLVVSDVVLLQAGDLDTSITRGKTGSHFLPLAEFFLASPGMTEQYSNMDTPYRYFSPVASLDKLNLSFTRESEHNGKVERIPYLFRGIKWYLKLAIKTTEFKPKPIELAQTGGDVPTLGKQRLIIQSKNFADNIPTIGSGMSIDPGEYTYLPMASNQIDYS